MTLYHRLWDNPQPPEHKTRLDIAAPVAGRVNDLDSLNNGLLRQRVFGEGAVIHLSGYQLFAPLAGTISYMPASSHHLRLTCSNGLQLMCQIGLHSEQLCGAGFSPQVNSGDKVRQGQLLLTFDLPLLKSTFDQAIAVITILNSNKVRGIQLHRRQVMAREDSLMTVFI